MITKTCCECQEQFEVEEAKAWATRCLPCWIAQQDRQGKKKVESLQAEVDYWRTRAQGGPDNTTTIDALKEKVTALEYQITKLQLDLMTARAKATTTGKSLPADWRDYLPRLIQLCHPDRHGGSELSNRATVWLLGLKKSIR
jgi:hypothetical protein